MLAANRKISLEYEECLVLEPDRKVIKNGVKKNAYNGEPLHALLTKRKLKNTCSLVALFFNFNNIYQKK